MTNKRKPYSTYPKEFKLEALRLMNESGRPASEVAMELGIRRNQLYKWRVNLPQFNGKKSKHPAQGSRLTLPARVHMFYRY